MRILLHIPARCQQFVRIGDGSISPQESMSVTTDMPLPYSKDLLEFGMKTDRVNELFPNLYNKFNYVLHYRNLKFYMSCGVKITKIHRTLEFKQSQLMEPFNKEMHKFREGFFQDG